MGSQLTLPLSSQAQPIQEKLPLVFFFIFLNLIPQGLGEASETPHFGLNQPSSCCEDRVDLALSRCTQLSVRGGQRSEEGRSRVSNSESQEDRAGRELFCSGCCAPTPFVPLGGLSGQLTSGQRRRREAEAHTQADLTVAVSNTEGSLRGGGDTEDEGKGICSTASFCRGLGRCPRWFL